MLLAKKAKEKETVKVKVDRRYSGILLHPTSLPSPYGIGDMGQGAHDFVDFLADAGQTLLISPEKLVEQKLITEEDLKDIPEFDAKQVKYGEVLTWKTKIFTKAFEAFKACEDKELLEEYEAFLEAHGFWVNDYAFYMAVRAENEYKGWLEWDKSLQAPTAKVRKEWEEKLADEIGYQKFTQFEFYKQWGELKAYANEKGVQIVGDMPIFVSIDSSDVWANKGLFCLDSKGYPTEVAGVPPDYFSATGQLWGNPLYNWNAHKKQGYEWWINRIKTQLTMVDYLRIDHFRGFESYWAVPASEETAINGKWRKGPGSDLFNAIKEALGGELPIFAEDLGIITPEVEALRDEFNFPGMKVLQFGFEAWPTDNFYPHNFKTTNCICYTGTHDNNTTVGWYKDTQEEARDRVRRYLNCDGGNVSWDFIRLAMSSIAQYAIYPMQDVLRLGSESRMNVPGIFGANWAWRFEKEDLQQWHAAELKKMTQLFNR